MQYSNVNICPCKLFRIFPINHFMVNMGGTLITLNLILKWVIYDEQDELKI